MNESEPVVLMQNQILTTDIRNSAKLMNCSLHERRIYSRKDSVKPNVWQIVPHCKNKGLDYFRCYWLIFLTQF